MRLSAYLLITVSITALASSAAAETAVSGAGAEASASDPVALEEIVVTARRSTENLQSVPTTVNAVTSETLDRLKIRQFQDIQTLVPGLSLQASSAGGSLTSASLRGVTFSTNSPAKPTVATYLNDAPVQLGFIFQSMFDVGQVEVLKGPQGTTRGVSAPSGAITLTTHRPNFNEFGGYADVTLTDLQGRNAQGALNIPIVDGKLAVRVAGLIDHNSVDGVRSIHSKLKPESKTEAVRVAVGFQPVDQLNVTLAYQHLDNDLYTFSQVVGPGAGSFTLGTTVFPAGTEPPLTPQDRAAVQNAANESHAKYDVITGQADWDVLGHHVSYVGSYQKQKIDAPAEGSSTGASNGDVGDTLPGVALIQNFPVTGEFTSQEIRISSQPEQGRMLDYTAGAFYSSNNVQGQVTYPGPLLPGAFGNTPVVNLAAFNNAYRVPLIVDVPSLTMDTSLFGSVTAHLGENTELSAGVRHIWSIFKSDTRIRTGNGLLNLGAIGASGAPCSIVGGTPGPGPGDCVLHTARTITRSYNRFSSTPNIYNVSLSHHFTPNLMAYATTGTAFRPPVPTTGLFGRLVTSTNPALRSLNVHPAETSTSYEVGVKSTWLDGRLRANASLFTQRFHNMTVFVPDVLYLNTDNGQATNASFTQSVEAKVQGFDLDAAFQVTPAWNISAQASYADGAIKGSLVPCNKTDAAGAPIFNTDGLISMCPGGSTSQLPYWNANLQSEYQRQVAEGLEGFVRVLATYTPQNKNRVRSDFTVPAYSIINLYIGVRSQDGRWEASVFARNAFNKFEALKIAPNQASIAGSLANSFPSLIHPTGYYQMTGVTPRREVGINVHYAFGSR